MVPCDVIRKKREGKFGTYLPKKNQKVSDLIYKFLLRESSSGVLNTFGVSKRRPGGEWAGDLGCEIAL